MIDHIAEQSGVASALVAQTLQHPPASTPSAIGDTPSAEHPDDAALYQTAQNAVAFYLAKRTEATRPPSGLGEALTVMRENLAARGDGSGETVVGVSALPPAALNRYLSTTELRQIFDHVYSVGHAAEGITLPAVTAKSEDWIRQLPKGATWPSPSVMKAICAAHHVKPEEAVLIGGNLGEEVGPALSLGMKAIYVRLGILDTATAEVEGIAPNATLGSQRPDGIVTRLQDLPHLPIFRRAPDEGRSAPPRPIKRTDRDR